MTFKRQENKINNVKEIEFNLSEREHYMFYDILDSFQLCS